MKTGAVILGVAVVAVLGLFTISAFAAPAPIDATGGDTSGGDGLPKPSQKVLSHDVATACKAANDYNASLKRAGLPTYPGWDKLSCQEKILAVASILGPANALGVAGWLFGGTIGNAAQQALDAGGHVSVGGHKLW